MLGRSISNFAHRLLRGGLVLKAVDGALETIGGILLSIVTPGTISRVAAVLTQHELAEDPHDFVANHLRTMAEHLTSDTRLFAVAYLLVHGTVKIVLALSMLQDRARVYPWALAFFLFFLIYEAYRLSYTHSVALAGFVCLDMAIVMLLHWEHGRRLRQVP